jgi:hypothetical protein
MVARPSSGLRVFVTTSFVIVLSTIVLNSVGATTVPRKHRRVTETLVIRTEVIRQINAVRHRFGLPSGRATTGYQSIVTTAVRSNNDPVAKIQTGTVAEFGVWGELPSRALSSHIAPHIIVDNWVYEDGWNSADPLNLDCTSPNARGCDAHRRAILSKPPFRGARLYIDIDVIQSHWHGTSGLSIAALLIWSMPKPVA